MRVETSVVIKRPIEEVWTFLLDPFNRPRASSTWLMARWTSRGPPGLGSTGQGRLVFLGFETRINATITEWDPPHAATLSVAGGMGRGLLSAILESTADGTKVVRVSDLEPALILKLLGPILGPFFRRRAEAADQKMKRLLEAGRS